MALSWAAPGSDGGSPLQGYNVYEGTTPGGESGTPVNGNTLIPSTVTSFSVSGLVSGTTYYFTVQAVNAVGVSPGSNEASARPGPPLNWSAAGSAELPVERWVGVSCPTSGFCAAVGGSTADTAFLQGGSWSAPIHVNTSSLSLISCASSSLCIAVNQTSNALFDYNGTTWSPDAAPPSDQLPLIAVSCSAGPDGFCMLMDNAGNTFTRGDGGNWAAGATLPDNTSLQGLTCLSSTSCLALMATFNTTAVTSYTVYTWNGTAWSATGSLPPVVVTDVDSVRGFSCSASTACVALLFDPTIPGNVLYTYNGSAWTGASLPGGFSPQRPVACAPGSNCFVMGNSASSGPGFFQYSGGTWSGVPYGTQGALRGSPTAMSCGSATFCSTVPGDNTLDVFNGTSWTVTSVGGSNQVQAVSCASSAFCAAVDNGGNYVTFKGTLWSTPPASVSTTCGGSCPQFFGADAISCPTAGSCAAIDSAGNVWRYASGAWSSLPADQDVVSSPIPQGGIACTTTGFCAVASGAQVATYNSATGKWTATSIDSTRQNLDSVACPAAGFCLAVDKSGQFTTWNGTSWSAMASFDPNATPSFPDSVACSSPSVCVAAGGDGFAEVYLSTGWSAPNPLAGGNSLSATSCVPGSGSLPAYCVVGGAQALYYFEVQGSVPTWSTAQSIPANNADSMLALGCGPGLCAATGVQNYAWLGTP